ncbi:hypothetical protein CYLTODRAFT_431056 [Cylindrobasidium torrendii FP15055 ss-10]|uniref:BAH-domain-containing protein n=1 Tax=Cylindrobasidium torrendii FP15055 ss-10 TaxID=1314674 RepID=A0A0D7BCP7_9AGAR|nr:hypothetical protein CYLTODRAFT_431056 [Cylindrobasidium torrendii FP15055 ss-10]
MEFLRPLGKHDQDYQYTRVRLAWYYRPSDVSDRSSSDSRLLLSGMFCEVVDINQIRARCHVVHRDKISDISAWRKKPDHFYYLRLFDPYMRKELEIIQATEVKNIPDEVRNVLTSRYEYVICEKEYLPDLTDNIRLCETCTKWCPTPDSVQCDKCKHYYHMACVQPPLTAKPSRGYGWSCANCSGQHEHDFEGGNTRQSTPSGKAPRPSAPVTRFRGRPRKDKNKPDDINQIRIKYFKMWPFRYFGQYTCAEETLDPDDLISPRAPIRVGPKFQMLTLPALFSEYPEDEERGGEDTVEIFGAVNMLTSTELEALKNGLTSDPKEASSVDWLTEVIRRYSEVALSAGAMSTVDMSGETRLEMWKDRPTRWFDTEWSREEVLAFEDAIGQIGARLRECREEVGTRSLPEVVRFYGHWKNGKLGEEHSAARRAGTVPEPAYRRFSAEAAAGRRLIVGLPDEESSVVTRPSKAPSCGACRTRETPQWWKAPKGLATSFLCDTCSRNWRKYADLNVRSVREESSSKAKIIEKREREGTPVLAPISSSKRSTKAPTSAASTPPPPSNVPTHKCLCCGKNGPVGSVLKCCKCGFSAHAGVIGAVVEKDGFDKWECDLCANEEALEASLSLNCALCPTFGDEKKTGPSPKTFHRACKPTEGAQWAHVVCAVFIPELLFSDCERLRLVEGASTIVHHRWLTMCAICHEKKGAVVKCSDCNREYHVSCAWEFGHRFGFEMQTVKSSRRDTTITTTFLGETAQMVPIISCKEHEHRRRIIHDMCKTNAEGDTALQVYCRAHKQASDQMHALLRKARRLDQLLNLREPGLTATTEMNNTTCTRCATQYTPAWHEEADGTYCHRCFFVRKAEGGTSSDGDIVMVQ